MAKKSKADELKAILDKINKDGKTKLEGEDRLTENEVKKVRERLRRLGYID